MEAKECKCCVCGKQAEVFWPIIDPDIPANPYCKNCVAKEKRKLFKKLEKIDKKYENKKD